MTLYAKYSTRIRLPKNVTHFERDSIMLFSEVSVALGVPNYYRFLSRVLHPDGIITKGHQQQSFSSLSVLQ